MLDQISKKTATEEKKKYESDLIEGHLYVMQNGSLQEIERDPDDTLKKIRIFDDAVHEAVKIQRSVRKILGGYKPDLSMVCSALIIAKAKNEEESMQAVKDLFADMTRKMLEQ
jgi:hypothetical protein